MTDSAPPSAIFLFFFFLPLFNMGHSVLCQGKPSSVIPHLQLNGFNLLSLVQKCKTPTVFPLSHAVCSFAEVCLLRESDSEPRYRGPTIADGKNRYDRRVTPDVMALILGFDEAVFCFHVYSYPKYSLPELVLFTFTEILHGSRKEIFIL